MAQDSPAQSPSPPNGSANDFPADDPADVPSELTPVRWLSHSPRGDVLQVTRDDQSLVLRLGPPVALGELALSHRVQSPGLVVPEAWGTSDSGRSWTTRPFVEGPTFDVAARKADPATLESWTLALLEILAELHGAGLIHRDIKAANVVVAESGPVLIDLDLAVDADSPAESAGSPLHIAPEVLLGQTATASSDLFALGAMLALTQEQPPAPDFIRRFPTRSFWEASGLDPGALPGVLGELTRQLLRRHPGERPASAEAAARRLTSTQAPLPTLGLPFLAGREEALRLLLIDLAPALRVRTCVLVTVPDAEERPTLLEALLLGLTVEAHATCQEQLREPADEAIQRIAARNDDVILVDGGRAEQSCGLGSLAELIVAFSASRPGNAATLALVLGEDRAQELLSLMGHRGLDDELSNLRVRAWPRLSTRALGLHIEHLTGGSSPDEAHKLADSLRRLTGGRWSEIRRRLGRATELGVLRPDPPRYTLLCSDWPDDEDGGSLDQDDLDLLAADCRAVLAALASCHWAPDGADLEAISGLDAPAVASALGELTRLGALPAGCAGRRGVQLSDGRWSRIAREAQTQRQRLALDKAALARAEASGQSAEVLALQRIALGPRGSAVEEILATVDSLLSSGHPAAARRLVRLLTAHCKGAARKRLSLAEARVELAQGDARQALQVLEDAFGASWKGADDEVSLVAAQAAEQCGRRNEARELYLRICEHGASRALRLRGRLGLAFSSYLGGDAEASLSQIGQHWVAQSDDAPETLAQLLDVRGSALTALRRFDEAEAAFDEARRQALVSADPLLIARNNMNRARLDRRCGRSREAQGQLRLAVESFNRAGHVKGRAQALNNLGVLHRDRGELGEARQLLLEAFSLLRRVGDAHGAASSLGSLAAAALEVGQPGPALETLRRAREVFAGGDHERELSFLDVQEAIAQALVGHHGEAAELLAGPRLEQQRQDGTPEFLRAEAILQLLGDQRARATETALQALSRARETGDAGKLFRCGSVLAAADPGNDAAAQAMLEAASRLEAPVREAEAAWRSASPTELGDPTRLRRWLDTFEEAGRTDLVAAVGRCLTEAADQSGDRSARRSAAARVTQAADALTDGLPQADRQAILERLQRLSGPTGAGARQAAGLSVDWLLSCNRRMATENDLEDLLLAIVDMALELTGARRGFLVLLEGEEVAVQVARNLDHTSRAADEARFSRTVVLEAVRNNEAILTTDAGADTRFSGARSISSFGLHSVLCVPLPGAEGVGALYLDDDQRRAVFDETDVERVRALADQAAVAIDHRRRRLEIERLNARLADRVAFAERELDQARTALRRQGRGSTIGGLLGESEVMRNVCRLIERVAPTELAVLVSGSSGTGKDLVSRALHECSDRARGPLIIENVAALPANLLESEMFGHSRGAFTGADRDRPGLFAEADGGTFVLDEIGELPLELQPKLLRVLESGEFRPVGSRRTKQVDVRIVAATNCDLAALVREGRFREDLYYRLNAVEVRLPDLSERLGDIPLLVQHFLDQLEQKQGLGKTLSAEVLAALVARPWPGQVRELANEVRRLYFLSDKVIDSPELVREAGLTAAPDLGANAEAMPSSMILEDVERAAVGRALRAAGQSKQKAARLLGISRAGLYAKIRRLGLDGGTGEDISD